MPDALSEREQLIWRRTAERLPVGLLRALDSDQLQLYVETWVEREEARQKIKEFGAVVKSPTQGVPVQSPYKSIQNKCTEILKGIMSDLGFSPTSRSRISTGKSTGTFHGSNRFASNAARKRA